MRFERLGFGTTKGGQNRGKSVHVVVPNDRRRSACSPIDFVAGVGFTAGWTFREGQVFRGFEQILKHLVECIDFKKKWNESPVETCSCNVEEDGE